eukprot:TRINITY_DN66823_c2_g1_i1.p1 TRINITY_DN66823_c2_g1~~TRINITY_DN66823_c2_g1_i1.p1  ORF type:complete len:505 (-),score=281.61 TRINITY_DN66823_c2_g1_i1:222-1532(-)
MYDSDDDDDDDGDGDDGKVPAHRRQQSQQRLSMEDDDVKDERRRIRQQALRIAQLRAERGTIDRMAVLDVVDENAVSIQELRKVYPPSIRGGEPIVAVKRLSIGVRQGEIYGFLGANGSGKSSTMGCITGERSVTDGDVYVDGLSILHDLGDVRARLGFCPQIDPLFERMTGREHLMMYARLRGVPYETAHRLTQFLLQRLSLMPYADKESRGYSGGNKRKLSLAIALVGNPKVLLLDEPTSGIDPVSQRFIWDCIASLCRNRTVLLTSHSMSEVEALCNRVSIMVLGRLRCIGSIQHLKSKFGSGYTISLQPHIAARQQRQQEQLLSDSDEDERKEKEQGIEQVSRKIDAFMTQRFPGCMLVDENGGSLKYRVPSQSLRLSTIFRVLEEFKHSREATVIDDYSVSQSTLESVFVTIARQAEEEFERLQQEQQAAS